MTDKTKNDLTVSFQKLSPKEGDIVTLRFPKGSTAEERVFLAEMLTRLNDQELLPKNVVILILPEDYNIEMLSEDQMGSLGWARKLTS